MTFRLSTLVPVFFALCALARADYFADLKTTRRESNPLVQWQHFGPGMSGYIDKFWIHATDPDVMFMDLDMGNSHGTWNHGDKWQTIRDSDGTGNVMTSITAVEFSHSQPDFGLLLAKDGVFSTNDRGRHWEFLTDTDPDSSEKHNVLTVDPNDDNVWYIGAGQCWMIKQTHFNKNGLVYSDDRNHSEGFILRSTDRGRTWQKITSVFRPDSDFSKIIVDPRDSRRLYASCQHGVYRSHDAGLNWSKVPGKGLPHNQPRDMASFHDSTTGEFLLHVLEVTHYEPTGTTIKTTGGVHRSADGGETWDNLTGNLAIDLTQIDSWHYQQKYWRAIAYWLDLKEKLVRQKYPDLPKATFSQFIRIDVDPHDRNRIYLLHNFKHDYSFPPGNIWMTTDGGAHWVAAAREGPYWAEKRDQQYWQSRGNPLGVNITFAHVQKEHTDIDNTATGPRFLAVNSIGEVYTAFAQQAMRSSDRGATWRQIDDIETAPGSGHWVGRGDSNLPGESLCVDTGTPGTYLFGSGEHGLWRNTHDGDLVYPNAIAVEQLSGQSTDKKDALSIGTIAVHPRNPKRIFTLQFRQTQRGSLRHSPDGGKTWQTYSTPIKFPAADDHIFQRSLTINPENPRTMYFCVPLADLTYWARTQWTRNGPKSFTGHGVYKSTDGGIHWTRGNPGIPADKSVYRLAIDRANPRTLYAALNQAHTGESGGLYKTTDAAGSWQPVVLPDGIESVNEVVVHRGTGDLYIACGTYTKDDSTGGAWVSKDQGKTWKLLFDMPNVRGISPSPVDPNVIAVNVGQAREANLLNPGAYVTLDAGATWDKINSNHGQPARINVLVTDPYDADVLWCGLYGTGFFKADLSRLRESKTAGK